MQNRGDNIIRPGEEKTVNLIITSNTSLDSSISLSTEQLKDIDIKFTPNNASILPFGKTVFEVNVRARENATVRNYIHPIIQVVSVWSAVENKQTGAILNTSAMPEKPTVSFITLDVIPPLNTEENLNYLFQRWIYPLTGIWSFLAGITAVLGPLIFREYNRRRRNHRQGRLM